MVGGGDGGCQPFLSSIPIEVLLGNRVVVLLYTLVSSLQSFVREFSLVLEEVGPHSSPLPSKVYTYMAIVLLKNNQNPYTSKKKAGYGRDYYYYSLGFYTLPSITYCMESILYNKEPLLFI